jgi:hypothetical protein
MGYHRIEAYQSREGTMAALEPLYNPYMQMLRTISRLDKLAAARSVFAERGMMAGTTPSYAAMVQEGGQPIPRARVEADDAEEDNDNGPAAGPKALSSVELARMPGKSFISWFAYDALSTARGYPSAAEALAGYIKQPRFPELLRRFLYDQLNQMRLYHPRMSLGVQLFRSNFGFPFCSRLFSCTKRPLRCWWYVPREDSVKPKLARGVRSIRHHFCSDRFRSRWHAGNGDWSCAPFLFLLFFSFMSGGQRYPCALVEWFIPGNEPDSDTGMWVVRPEFQGNGRRALAIIHLDSIARAAHLLPVFGSLFFAEELHFSDSLDVYRAYIVNNNIDHHCNDFLSTS